MIYSKGVYGIARLSELFYTSSFMQSLIENKDKKRVLSLLFNRVEEILFQKYPEIKGYKEELTSLEFKTLVSDSCPTIFGFGENSQGLFGVKKWAKRKGLKSEFVHLSPVSCSF